MDHWEVQRRLWLAVRRGLLLIAKAIEECYVTEDRPKPQPTLRRPLPT